MSKPPFSRDARQLPARPAPVSLRIFGGKPRGSSAASTFGTWQPARPSLIVTRGLVPSARKKLSQSSVNRDHRHAHALACATDALATTWYSTRRPPKRASHNPPTAPGPPPFPSASLVLPTISPSRAEGTTRTRPRPSTRDEGERAPLGSDACLPPGCWPARRPARRRAPRRWLTARCVPNLGGCRRCGMAYRRCLSRVICPARLRVHVGTCMGRRGPATTKRLSPMAPPSPPPAIGCTCKVLVRSAGQGPCDGWHPVLLVRPSTTSRTPSHLCIRLPGSSPIACASSILEQQVVTTDTFYLTATSAQPLQSTSPTARRLPIPRPAGAA